MAVILWGCLALNGLAGAPPTQIRFNRDIQPILSANCYQCHGPDKSTREAKLRLDLEDHAKEVIVAGKPDVSELMARVASNDPDEIMPPPDSGKSLTPQQVVLLRAWIEQGAAYEANPMLSPIKTPPVPAVRNSGWPRRELDRYVLARLEAAGLEPAADADRHTWLRRVYFDLTGLPPSPEEIEAFMADTSTNGYDQLVDRLLKSPHFGERWGRHWLDLVRYAESFGYEHDWPIPLAWPYRDYVIRMFNEDVPYDQMIREHLAGDLLDKPRVDPERGFNESVIGTGFWYMHGQMSQPVDVMQHESDRFDNQIDTFSRGFLGVTMACARCHDHKFDPISTADYYGMMGFLRSSRRDEAYLDPGGKIGSAVRHLREIREEAKKGVSLAEAGQADAPHEEPKNTILFENFDGETYGDWAVLGDAFGRAPAKRGQWIRNGGGVARLQGGFAHSGMLSGKLRGTLQSRDFKISHDRVWLRVAGKGTIRIIIHGYMMQRHRDLLFAGTEIKVDTLSDRLTWVELGKDLKNYKGLRAYLEIEDHSDEALVIDEIRFANAPPPKENHPALLPASPQEAAALAPFVKAMGEAERDLTAPMQVLAMRDGPPADEHVRIRGIVRSEGELVPRRAPAAIGSKTPKPVSTEEGSGRLGLAEWMVNRDNPLTARVRANWVWQHLTGRGIVASADDFGAMGEPPSHPELLDFLADKFRGEMRWSIKQLIREIVLSRTYRMASAPKDQAAELADPNNILLHRFNVRRLEGEAIRDALLATSGSLDLKAFGPPVSAYLPPYEIARARADLEKDKNSGPLDGAGRRSIYQQVRRNFISPFLLSFDVPSPSKCVAKRGVSNVPAQGLIMMNNPLIAQQANLWAKQVMKTPAPTRERIMRMSVAATGRPATEQEVDRIEQYVAKQAIAFNVAKNNIASDQRVWASLAHSFFMLKEFQYVR